MQRNKYLSCFLVFAVAMMLAGCFHKRVDVRQPVTDSITLQQLDSLTKQQLDTLTKQQLDSITFARTHHYTNNYNFVVSADSLVLTIQLPEEAVSELPTDSIAVMKDERLVVADILVMPNDTVDSIWVQLAGEGGVFGWVHERDMLKRVDPDDPISQFISFFSDEHILILFVIFVIVFFSYAMFKLNRRQAYIVHLNDIATFYPTLLTLVVAIAATLYSSIQMFAPDSWREFYFHPSLNPFSQSPLIAFFLISVWAMLIAAIAAIDETLRHLAMGDAVLYLVGLMGVCAFNYVVFTISTMYYIGYLLLIAYVLFALWRYLYHTRSNYVCGNCGKQIKSKGRCPHCGAMNE